MLMCEISQFRFLVKFGRMLNVFFLPFPGWKYWAYRARVHLLQNKLLKFFNNHWLSAFVFQAPNYFRPQVKFKLWEKLCVLRTVEMLNEESVLWQLGGGQSSCTQEQLLWHWRRNLLFVPACTILGAGDGASWDWGAITQGHRVTQGLVCLL